MNSGDLFNLAKAGSTSIQSDGRCISESWGAMARFRLITARSATALLPARPALVQCCSNAAPYRHAVLYAACQDGVRRCPGNRPASSRCVSASPTSGR